MKRGPRVVGSPLLALLLASFGCAAHAPAVETSTGQSAAQTEIASLEKKIADRKNSLSGGGSRSPIQGDSQPVPMAAGEVGGRCDGVCQAAEEICICNRRICKLAGEISDEKSAESCRRSQKDCEEAGKSCATCR